jgi:hypothetical protein
VLNIFKIQGQGLTASEPLGLSIDITQSINASFVDPSPERLNLTRALNPNHLYENEVGSSTRKHIVAV